MSASDDQAAELASRALLSQRALLAERERCHADAYLCYLREAQAAGWSWRRIARTIGIAEKSVREYWSRHHIRSGRLPNVQEAES